MVREGIPTGRQMHSSRSLQSSGQCTMYHSDHLRGLPDYLQGSQESVQCLIRAYSGGSERYCLNFHIIMESMLTVQ